MGGQSTIQWLRKSDPPCPHIVALSISGTGMDGSGTSTPTNTRKGGSDLRSHQTCEPTTHQLPYDIQHTQYCEVHNIKVHRTTEGGITVLELWCVFHLLSTYISSARLRIVYACLCLAFILQLEDTDSSSNLVRRGRNNNSNGHRGLDPHQIERREDWQKSSAPSALYSPDDVERFDWSV